MRRHLAALCAALAAAGGTACAALERSPEERPGGRLTTMSHKLHVESDVDCGMCHEPALAATAFSADRLLPGHETCDECHEQRKDGVCGFCHPTKKKERPFPDRARHLIIDHAAHIARAEAVVEKDATPCSKCHTELPEPTVWKDLLPKMAACLGCHNHAEDFDAGRCHVCHRDLTRYPLVPVSLYVHAGDWVREHPRHARTGLDTCRTCHEQTFCADCHAARTAPVIPELVYPDRVDRDFIHRNDFVTRHPIEARADEAMCQRCHGTTFCRDCHTERGLASGALSPLSPHPPGWYMPGGERFHGEAARADIVSCATCHDDGPATICIECHRVGAAGGNPHPGGWTGRHDAEEITRNPMCGWCHL